MIADGLVRRSRYEDTEDLWRLSPYGFYHLPTPGYAEALEAFLDWAGATYGEDWDAVCEASDSLAVCTALFVELAKGLRS